MKRPVLLLLAWVCGIGVLITGCAVPRAIWPQADITPSESIGPTDGPIVLVASRDSKFKRALVARLRQTFTAAGMAQQTVGVGALKDIDAEEYDGVVVISTCLAWGLDRDVEKFVERQTTNRRIVHVITAADPDWQLDPDKHDIDAITSASNLTRVDAVAEDVVEQLHAHPRTPSDS